MNIVIVGCGNVGFETAKLLAENNSILLIDIQQQENLTEFLEKEKNVYFALGDALDLLVLRDILNSFNGTFNSVDALISTVGINCSSSSNDNFDEFRKEFEQNFFGNLVPIKAVLEKMIPLRSGRIIVLSSTSGIFTYAGLKAYSPAKWAITSLCNSLRNELRSYNISVDVLFPKTIKNKYSKSFVSNNGIDPELVARKIASIINKPESKNHFVPKKYTLLHPLERLLPFILDRRAGLISRRKRKKNFKSTKINSVLITGASSGLGKDLAKLYSKTVKIIYLVARNYNQLLQIKKEIMRSSECEVHISSVDMADSKGIADYVDKIEDIDLLINNAGSSVIGQVNDIPVNVYTQNFSLNFFGPVQMTAEFLNKRSKPLKIINVLSTVAIAGRQERSCYSSTKAALWAFTRSLRRTIGNNIQVVEVLPSTFQSNFMKNTVRIKPRGNTATKKSFKEHRYVLKVRNLTSEKVAKSIYKAERQGKEIVFIPFKSKLFLFLEACMPRLFRKLYR